MRLLFAATGDIALPSFRSLLDGDSKPLALITQPDRPVGRKQILQAPHIKNLALEAGVPVLQPERIGEITETLAGMQADLMVVLAYGQILREDILSLPGTQVINLHASLLPKYRGAACIQAAIDAGEVTTGVTAMHVVRKLDAGDMIHHRSIPILPDDTGGALHDKLADLAAEVLQETLAMIQAGTAPRIPQDESKVSYISKLHREHGRIDWSRPASEIERRIRAYSPWPGTYTVAEEDSGPVRLKIFPPTEVICEALQPGQILQRAETAVVGCGDGSALLIHQVQPEGSKHMGAGAYLRGKSVRRLLSKAADSK